jgi:hypothetical protein
MPKKTSLPSANLSHNYHILKLMTHSIYSIPTEGISPVDVIEKTRQWLGISPFQKKSLMAGLDVLSEKGLIRKDGSGKKASFSITEKGRESYDSYVDVMTVWKLEQNFGEKFKLFTVSQVFPKSKKHPATFIPESAFYDWPLTFVPSTHKFEGAKEIRSYEVFEKKS